MGELPPLEQRSLRLDNGVRATLLRDPQARRVALAAGVDAGSLHEPEAWPGLAHFLEHALFLGSAGLAGTGAFAGYVHGAGGRYNARTLGLCTQFYLEMPARELAPALERLCDLLARPLLLPERLLAEREVLHAEYLARCQDGDSQLLGALAGLLDPAHPLARFHAGARDTLEPRAPAFLADLRAWHARHYRGENLCLLLCGPQSLDELEARIRAGAASLPAGARLPAPAWPSPWPAGQGPAAPGAGAAGAAEHEPVVDAGTCRRTRRSGPGAVAPGLAARRCRRPARRAARPGPGVLGPSGAASGGCRAGAAGPASGVAGGGAWPRGADRRPLPRLAGLATGGAGTDRRSAPGRKTCASPRPGTSTSRRRWNAPRSGWSAGSARAVSLRGSGRNRRPPVRWPTG
ncbi:insulinase family protein [Azotobacter vinelandii]